MATNLKGRVDRAILTEVKPRVEIALAGGPTTVGLIMEQTGLTTGQIRLVLHILDGEGRVTCTSRPGLTDEWTLTK